MSPNPLTQHGPLSLAAARGVFFDLKKLLEENGLNFREGDFALLASGKVRRQSKLFARLSGENLQLLHLLIEASFDGGLPEFLEFSLQEKVGEEGEIAKSVVVPLGWGMPGEVDFGRDLQFEIEAVNDQAELIEARATLSQGGGENGRNLFKTAFSVESGVPLVVQESRVKGERRAWVLTARVVNLETELERFLRD